MRTKALLCAAALAAGAVSSMAQSNVYSLNIVGYVNITQQPSQYGLWANPLNTTNNDVAYLFPNAANFPGLSVYKFNGLGYDQASYDPDAGGWTAAVNLGPGEGFWLQTQAGTAYQNTFVGEVVLNSTNAIPTGYSLKASAYPSSQPIQTGLQAPLKDFDAVFFYNGAGYDQYSIDPDAGGWTPSEPSPAVAQGFWILRNAGNGATNWVQSFTP
jgi:hypothetical protein